MRQLYNLILLSVVFLCSRELKAQVNTQDSLALVDLYNSTEGAHWYNHTNWLTNQPISGWYGVTLTGNRVYALNLSGNNLSGVLPSSLGNINLLSFFQARNNNISGSIPASLANIKTLNLLYLDHNNLSGNIPPELGSIYGLSDLALHNNKLSGNIPSELGDLSYLHSLYLSNNELTGRIPYQLGKLKYLVFLNLDNNQLKGNIPSSFGKLTSIAILNLNSNNLTGSIPNELGNLTSLQILRLDFNKLSGTIPAALEGLTGINQLYLNNNRLTGEIPSELGNISSLQQLLLHHNYLTGNIPSTFGNLTSVNGLYLNNNHLSGHIPSSLSNLQNLTALDLSHNHLNGSIPSALSKIKSLRTLMLSNNRLSGRIPSFSQSDWPSIDILQLDSNQFTFAGMENIATTFPFAVYAPQANINMQQNGNVLTVSAGGILSNNTYKWYKNGVLFKIKTGNASLTVNNNGNFSVAVTNSVATQLTLYSDTVRVTNLLQANNTLAIAAFKNNFSIYPNPVKSITTISFNATGNCTIQLTDVSGNVLQTKTMNATGKSTVNLNMGKYPGGVYFVSLISGGKPAQTLQLNKD